MTIATKILRVVYVLLLLYIAVFFKPNDVLLPDSEASLITKTDVKTISKLNKPDNFFAYQPSFSSPFFILPSYNLLLLPPFNENIFYP